MGKHSAPRGGYDSPRAWGVAVGAGIANGVAFGTLYTFGNFVDSMGEEFNSGLGPTLLVFGITMFLFFGTGAISGRWSDKYGPRPLVLVGGSLFVAGLVATSYVNAIWQGYLVYGIGAGFGGGLFSGPLFAVTAAWFQKFRALAQGIAATGPGIGTFLLVPQSERMIESLGWRDSYQALALIAAVSFAVALVLVRRPPPVPKGDAREHVRAVLRSTAFRRMTIGGCCMSVALIGAFAFIVPFAEAEGIAADRAAGLIAVIGLSSILGRIVITGMAGRLGPIRLLQLCMATQPIAYLVWVLAGDNYTQLTVFAFILGVSYGGFVALMGDATAHLFGLVGIGAVMGLVYLASGAGSLVGPPLAGFLADETSPSVPLVVILGVSLFGAIVISRLQTYPVNFGDPTPRLTAIDRAAPRETPTIDLVAAEVIAPPPLQHSTGNGHHVAAPQPAPVV